MLNDKHNVTVLIPVGKHAIYREYLPEAIQSVFNQVVLPNEILLIDDGCNITDQDIHNWFSREGYPLTYHSNVQFNTGKLSWDIYHTDGQKISLWHSPFANGFISAFNNGVALASNDLIVYLAADDKLEPDAIKDCIEAWEENNQKDAWYAMTYESADGISDIPINAAMVTRNLWMWMNGYPPSAFAGPDALALSRLMVYAPDRIIKVKSGKVNYTIRKHEFQETNHQASFFLEEMGSIRNKETARFKPNEEIILK